MTLDDSVHGMRLRVMQRAQALGNVSAVCRELGISRTLFYRWRKRFERYGVDGVHPRRRGARRGRPVQVPAEIERLVLSVAISTATWGCGRIAAYLTRTWRLRVAPSTVQRVLRRAGLATRRARLTVLEQEAARTAGLLTERTRQRLWRARYGRTRHVEASEPGELVCLDTFYIGQLKGVGKVWQITACDAASSYGVAALLPTHTAAEARRFCATSSSRTFGGRGGPCGGSSPTAGPSSTGPSMTPVGSSACVTPGPSPAMPGPTASWNASKGPSCKNTGASPFGAAISLAARRCSGRSRSSCATTTTNDRIKATGSAAGRPRRSSGARSRPELMDGSGTARVLTPFRTWTT